MKRIPFNNDNKKYEFKGDEPNAKLDDSDDIVEEKNVEFKIYSKKQQIAMYLLIVIAVIFVVVISVFTFKNNKSSNVETTNITTVTSATLSSTVQADSTTTQEESRSITTTTKKETTTSKPATIYSMVGQWNSSNAQLILNKNKTFTYTFGTNNDKSTYKGTYAYIVGNTAYDKVGLDREKAANIFHLDENEIVDANAYYLVLTPSQFSYNDSSFSKVNSDNFKYEPLFSHLIYIDSYESKITMTYYNELLNDTYELIKN